MMTNMKTETTATMEHKGYLTLEDLQELDDARIDYCEDNSIALEDADNE